MPFRDIATSEAHLDGVQGPRSGRVVLDVLHKSESQSHWMLSPLLPFAGGLKDTDARLACFSCRSLPDLDDVSYVGRMDVDLAIPSHIDFWWCKWQGLSLSEKCAKVALSEYPSFFMSYLMTVILLGAICLYLGGDFDAEGAFFMACSSTTQAGLTIIDYADASLATHIISLALSIAGSPLLLTLLPVLVRRKAFICFRKYCEGENTYLPSMDDLGALKVLTRIVLGYWCGVMLIGFILLLPVHFPVGGPSSWGESWRGAISRSFFMTSSSVQNTGLSLTPASLELVAGQQYVLYVMGLLIILGNTGAPICLRMLTVMLFRCARKGRHFHDQLLLLLAEPRHFYTHIFSAVHTTWLAMTLFSLLIMQIALSGILDWDNPVLTCFSPNVRVANLFFQASSTRTAGLNSLPLDRLSMPTNFVILVCMYISTSPVTVTMRSTSVKGGRQTVHEQVREYFTQHLTLLAILHLVIIVLERRHISTLQGYCTTAEACDLRADFSFFKIVYEIVSAYGTVGLSLGSVATGNSFCADWTPSSRVVLCVVMLLGRTRDLPRSINHAFNLEAGQHNYDRPSSRRCRSMET